mgnify:CR=1 FL=1
MEDTWLNSEDKNRYFNNGNFKKKIKKHMNEPHIKVRKKEVSKKDIIDTCPICNKVRMLTTDVSGNYLCSPCFLQSL